MRQLIEDSRKELDFLAEYHSAGTEGQRVEIRERHEKFIEGIKAKGHYYRYFKKLVEAAKCGNWVIDFNETIWDNEVPGIVADLQAYGIQEFTISSTSSRTVDLCWLFQKNGCPLVGLTRIYARWKSLDSDEYEKIPAFKFQVR